MRIKFCGANRQVTGSAHLLTLDDGYNILLDCGLYQGNKEDMAHFNKRWLFDPQSIDCVILSHAHIDHSGRIPRLIRDGFEGQIFSTHATRSLSSIMLLDCAYILERDAEYEHKKNQNNNNKEVLPLYTSEHVKKTMNLFYTMPYGRWFSIRHGVEVMFLDAGHILGSASVTLRIRENNEEVLFGFTGDIGRPNRPILRDPQPMPEVDYLICESTYGDKDHEAKPQEEEKFLKIIRHTCMEKKGKLIIPAFSVGRTQEIVYLLDRMETEGLLPHLPVFVDSPLSVNATQVFGAHPECYDEDLQKYLLVDDNPFGFNALTYVRDVEISKSLNSRKEPCIIISSSGMMNAGRVKHHLFNNLDNPQNTLLIVGYCTPETPGGRLLAGAKELRLFGEVIPVRAAVERMESFSAHGDRYEMLDFIKNQKKLKNLFLVHGEYETQIVFQGLLGKNGFTQCSIPSLGQNVELSN